MDVSLGNAKTYLRHGADVLLGLERAYVSFPTLGLSYGRIPKNANTAVKLALKRALKLPDTGVAPAQDQYWRRLPTRGVRFETLRAVARRRYAIVFAVVRDPGTRVASCYENKIVKPYRDEILGSFAALGFRKGMSLAEFVDHACALPDHVTDMHLRSQVHYLVHRGTVVPNRLLAFEHLAEDWEALCADVHRHIGLSLGALRAVNESGSLPALDAAMRRKLERRYAEDYALHARLLDERR